MKQRLISSIIACLIAIPIIYIGGVPYYLFGILIAILALTEILKLKKQPKAVSGLAYLTMLTILLCNIQKNSLSDLFNPLLMMFTFFMLFLPVLYYHDDNKYNIVDAFFLTGCALFLSYVFSVFVIVRNMSLLIFIFVILIPIFNDILAHSIGTMFGKHKLVNISPNKTWEGSIGGLLLGTALSTLFYLFLIDSNANILKIIVICLFLSIIGQLGDLFFSSIKRYFKVKDFSNIMPGHGGILDRLDSMIFVFLAFVFIINLL